MLSDAQLERYSRQIILDTVGEEGQEELLQSRVLVIGAGGLGSPVLLYLAAAGVGNIGVVDFDTVDSSNLQRQIVHMQGDISRPKILSAKEKIENLNQDVSIKTYHERLHETNIEKVFEEYTVIVDGSDNFVTRYLVNKTAWRMQKILVSGALSRFEGQVMVIDSRKNTPCYRCIFPTVPENPNISRCDTIGVFGATAGVIGTLQAVEVLKVLLNIGTTLHHKMLLVDTLDITYKIVETKKNPYCKDCQTKKIKV